MKRWTGIHVSRLTSAEAAVLAACLCHVFWTHGQCMHTRVRCVARIHAAACTRAAICSSCSVPDQLKCGSVQESPFCHAGYGACNGWHAWGCKASGMGKEGV